MPLTGTYDPWLVSVSIAIAVCASYAALRLGARTTAAKGTARLVWLAGGGVAMGFGIWSMHYVGMLAFSLPVAVLYDLPTVIISLLAAIIASGVALFIVSRETITAMKASLGSIFMGGGIVAMHYIGMAAMRLPAMCSYNPALLVLSGIIAVVCSFAALWATFWLRDPKTPNGWKILSAVAMGIGIAAMHYTGMAAAKFYPSSRPIGYSNAVSVSTLGTTGITIVAFLVLGFAVFTSIIDQRLAAHRAMAEELYRSREAIERSNVALSEFAHMVAHDLQSPLRLVRNYVQLLARNHGREMHEKARRLMQSIEERVIHMDELIGSLLSYAAATEPPAKDHSSVSLSAAFQQAMINLQLLISETQAQVAVDPLPTVTACPIQMVQVFQNLLSNAIKYRKPNSVPKICISAREE